MIDDGQKAVDELRKKQITFIPIGHKDYPVSLLRIPNAPRWIFVKGSLEPIKSNSIVALIGTRKATLDGQRLAYLCASTFVRKNLVVLSGLAEGIDEKAHQGAVDYYGQTIAVLGYGLLSEELVHNQVLWMQIIEREGSIVSEYLPNDSPSRQTFLRRNELQAALSKVVIPIECPSLESGTGATIRRALALDTPVIGITYNNHVINEETLASTRANLSKIGVQIFNLEQDHVDKLWGYLESVLLNHNLVTDQNPRKVRFLNTMIQQFVYAQNKFDLNQRDIEYLTNKLLQELRK